MASNRYKVPKKQWRKWSLLAQAVFNRSHSFFIKNQKNMTHPEIPLVRPKFWKTTAWNAAWIAADSVDNVVPTTVITK